MERSPSSRAFTLAEMIVVIAVIAVLSGLVIALAGPTGVSSRRAKAQTEKNALVSACEVYKTDNGGYPQDNPPGGNGASVTNDLDPRIHFNPTTSGYTAANLFLYKQLTGDDNANGTIDAGETGKRYAPDFFKSSRFDAGYRTSGTVSYYTDPFGYPFGYSTAGLKAEQDYQASQQTDPAAGRPATSKGYNPTFDFWSTAGSIKTTGEDQSKWITNW